MAGQDGMDYPQNYDVIVKWLADAMTGETLDVLGIRSGRIEEVQGFEPVEIAVQAERVDLILRDIRDQPGSLPLLSHALLETWKRRRGHTLTLGGYAEAGGVHGAIAKTAEADFE